MVNLKIALALTAYMTIIITASGSLRIRVPKKDNRRHFDVRSATAWGFAQLSTFGLPWGGIPLFYYLGVGSWTWFVFSALSLCILKDDGRGQNKSRRFFAIMNIAVIMSAVYAFMFENGIPGDIPGIEGIGAIGSLEGLSHIRLMLAQACFTISGITSFLPIHSNSERASAILSFSYASFLSIAFLPPAHVLFSGIRPDIAILCDTASYFLYGWFIHTFIMNTFSTVTSLWRNSLLTSNVALTAAGIYILFSAA